MTNERQAAELHERAVAARTRARALVYIAGVLVTAIGAGFLTRWPAACIVVGVGLIADAWRRQEGSR